MSNLLFFFSQGEAGQDGLSLPGPPGPPGPPGQIFNLQDVSIQRHFFFLSCQTVVWWKTWLILPLRLLVQLLLNDTDGAFNFSGIYDAQGLAVSIRRKKKKTNNLSRISNDIKMTALQSLMASSCRDVSPWEIHDTNSYACLLHICMELE